MSSTNFGSILIFATILTCARILSGNGNFYRISEARSIVPETGLVVASVGNFRIKLLNFGGRCRYMGKPNRKYHGVGSVSGQQNTESAIVLGC